MQDSFSPRMVFIGFFALAILAIGYFALSASHGDNTTHMTGPAKQDKP